MDNSLFEHGHDTTQSQPEASAASRHPAAGDQADGVNPESSAEAFTSTSAEHGAPDADRGSSSGSASAAADTGESSRDAGLRNPRWGAGPTLYTLDEIRESPSRKFHGVSEKEEKAVHRLGAKFILDAGRKMHLTDRPLSSAMVYFHHFYMKFSIREFDWFEVAVASLFLAAKVEDQKVDVRAILTPCLEIKGLKYEETRNSRDLTRHILDNEILLLQVMNFHIKLDPPLAVAMQIFKKVFVGSGSENSALFYIPKDAQQEILKSLKSVLNSSNQTIVCCFASPKEIAVACIQMAILLYQMKTSETGRLDIPDDWFTSKIVGCSISESRLFQIREFITETLNPPTEKGNSEELEKVSGATRPRSSSQVLPLDAKRRRSDSDNN